MTLCTDDVFPDDLAANGGLDDVVRRLVAPRAEARMGAARRHAERRRCVSGRADLGLIAPGRRADIVVFARPGGFPRAHVFANGGRSRATAH